MEEPPESTKPRSCAICASRKVKCDKRSPCGNCRRAGLACVLPAADPRPRWAKRFAPSNGGSSSTTAATTAVSVDKILDRLKTLESLVKDLSSELETARAATPQPTWESDTRTSSSLDSSNAANVHQQVGRLILHEQDPIRAVSSGFWSRIDDELDGLRKDAGESGHDEDDDAGGDDERLLAQASLSVEADRQPLHRHAFLFRHNVLANDSSAQELFPLPSQIPFLLEVYKERVHYVISMPHMPMVHRILENWQTHGQLDFEEEALLFAVYYSAIASMNDHEVESSFGASKNELILRFRMGLEYALAKADFLNSPSLMLIQAIIIWLSLARRHDSPKFVWMMTGLVIRMGHYLGLQHDGANSKHLSLFEIEMRRRAWWGMCALDMRSTEDQGTELAIRHGTFTTQLPSSVNDADISPTTTKMPPKPEALVDTTMHRVCSAVARTIQEMMAAGPTATLEDSARWLQELEQLYVDEYFHYADRSHKSYQACTSMLRLILGRISLLSHLPVLFSQSDHQLSAAIRTKLLIAAIDIAEHNHGLNSEPSCRKWQWVFQSHQHWHAVVYLLIEVCRRPWSPIMERAWTALHSPWLIPARAPVDSNFSVWIPLRQLMRRAQGHRDAEVARLRADPAEAARVETEDQQNVPIPSGSVVWPQYFGMEIHRRRWRELITPEEGGDASGYAAAAGVAAQTYEGAYQGAEGLVSNFATANEQTIVPMAGEWSSPDWIWPDAMDYAVMGADPFSGESLNTQHVASGEDALQYDWGNWLETAQWVSFE